MSSEGARIGMWSVVLSVLARTKLVITLIECRWTMIHSLQKNYT